MKKRVSHDPVMAELMESRPYEWWLKMTKGVRKLQEKRGLKFRDGIEVEAARQAAGANFLTGSYIAEDVLKSGVTGSVW